jgi:hypothetical protein
MTKIPSLIDDWVHPILVDNGYARVDECIHKATWGSSSVEHFIYISELQKSKDTITGEFGIRNEVAEVFSCNAIRAYGGELFKVFKCGEPTSCAMRFSFAKLEPSGWPVHLASISGKALGNRFHDFIVGCLVPTFGHVTKLEELLALLAADMPFLPWRVSNGAIRAAQIVALAGQVGLDATRIRGMLESHMPLIAHGVSRTSEMRTNPAEYIDRILDDWAASSLIRSKSIRGDSGPTGLFE